MTGRVNGTARRRKPAPSPPPTTVRELMRPNVFADRPASQRQATAEAWAIASARASKIAPSGTIGGKKGQGS